MIIERNLYVDNESMYKHFKILKDIVTKTEEVTQGRSKVVYKKQKYKTHPSVTSSIVESYNYYKKLYEKDMERSSKIKFRDYQEDIIKRGISIVRNYGFLYLAMEVRTGKTLTSIGIAELLYPKNVLFVTKKKAISSIEADRDIFDPSFYMEVINYESLHTISDRRWDLIICDEAHSMGAFPKPSNRAEDIKKLIGENVGCKVILLSGTPTPESYSQMYHQVYGIPNNPFREYKNFYRFCDRFVDVKEKMINSLRIKDYSKGKDSILGEMRPFTINYTQAEAGFSSKVTEEVLYVKMKDVTYSLIDKLKKDLVIQGKDEVILADTPVKLMTKVHQMCSGTIKFESGNSKILDLSKAEFIKEYFKGKKIGIFYKFKEELNALKEVFTDELTTDLDDFDSNRSRVISLQIVSGREGISLKNADYLVFYNIDFSATSYWQSKDRMTTKDRLENNVYWIFSEGGIESDIYKAVTKKKDYTVNHFKKLLL